MCFSAQFINDEKGPDLPKICGEQRAHGGKCPSRLKVKNPTFKSDLMSQMLAQIIYTLALGSSVTALPALINTNKHRRF